MNGESHGFPQASPNEEEGDEDELLPISKSIHKLSFSEQLENQKYCENLLIIDGAYFEIGIKELERHNPTYQCLSVPKNIDNLLALIENISGVKPFDWKSFHTAEEPNNKKRKAYYSVLESYGFKFDIREYKSKKVRCPNNNCQHSTKAFVTKVQAEVDVAIAMTTMELLLAHPEIKNVVFIIGDRDFYDLFRYLSKIKMNTYIFGFRANLSSHVFNVFSPKHVFYINDYWEDYISPAVEEFPPLTPTNVKPGENRQINFRKCNSEAIKFKPAPEKESVVSSKKKKRKKKSKAANGNGNGQARKEEEKKKANC